jgi:hypothetical protein
MRSLHWFGRCQVLSKQHFGQRVPIIGLFPQIVLWVRIHKTMLALSLAFAIALVPYLALIRLLSSPATLYANRQSDKST